MKLLIIAGLTDYKLRSKIEPILELPSVEETYLVRNQKLDDDRIKNVNPPFLKSFWPFAEIWKCMAIFLLMLLKKPDYVIGIHYEPHCIWAGLFGKLFNKKTIYMITEDPSYYSKRPFFKAIMKWADYYVVRGTQSIKYLQSLDVRSEKIQVIPNRFDWPKATEEELSRKRRIDLVFAGSFVKEKRPDLFIEIAAQAIKQKPDFKVVMAGEGPLLNQCKSIVVSLGVESNIEFRGNIADMRSLFLESKTLLIPSDTEGLPMVLLEAASCGCRIIAKDRGDMSDYRELFEVWDEENLIKSILNDRVKECFSGSFSPDSEKIKSKWKSIMTAAA